MMNVEFTIEYNELMGAEIPVAVLAVVGVEGLVKPRIRSREIPNPLLYRGVQ